MAAPRLAKALVTLRDQVNAKWPSRSKASDGWIGDSAHSSRRSDHNPNPAGVVCALDITNDPAHGLDASRLAETLRASRDPRLGYVISNGRIANPGVAGGAWRKYSGANPHTKHCHISLKQDASRYDDRRVWVIDGAIVAPGTGAPAVVPQRPLVKRGAKGLEVARAQTLLNAHDAGLLADAVFGRATHDAVVALQKARGLRADGAIGPKTWDLLEAGKGPESDRDALSARGAGPDFDRIVKHYEGRADSIYRIGGLLHGGYGHQLKDGEGWAVGDLIPEAQIEAWYAADKALAVVRVLKHISAPLNQALFDAVASIVWNGGDFDDPRDRADSPLYWKSDAGILANLLNARDFAKVPACIRALGAKPARDGKVYRGIANRRETEAERAEGRIYRLR
jgi:GH24 family phage-related lysozyme (muramidase)